MKTISCFILQVRTTKVGTLVFNEKVFVFHFRNKPSGNRSRNSNRDSRGVGNVHATPCYRERYQGRAQSSLQLTEEMSDFVAPKRRITQDTFDEVVHENVEEFGLSKDEAILDAWKQFNTQGVDLTDIDLSGGVGKQEMLGAIAAITTNNSSAGAEASSNTERITNNLDLLRSLCSDQQEMSKRNLVLMRTNGGLDALHALMLPAQLADILVKALALLELVSTNSGTCAANS